MDVNKPVLSICIPTYNRSGQLEQALNSLVSQDGFEEIEIVISDNCSTDDTPAVGRRYAADFENIRYYRNAKNIIDANHSLALKRGKGMVRKLSNDTIIYKPGAVLYMISNIKKYAESRPLLYFLNAFGPSETEQEYDTIDKFLRKVSYYITWIAPIAVWEEDCSELCESMAIYEKYAGTYLAQVPYLIELLKTSRKGRSVVLPKNIMQLASVEKKDLSYGLFDVFHNTFLGFLEGYVCGGVIQNTTYEYIREDLLINFFSEWVVQFEENKRRYNTSGENLRELVDKAYENEIYYKKYKRKRNKRRIRVRLSRIYHFLCAHCFKAI